MNVYRCSLPDGRIVRVDRIGRKFLAYVVPIGLFEPPLRLFEGPKRDAMKQAFAFAADAFAEHVCEEL